jgi:hypothetical protein
MIVGRLHPLNTWWSWGIDRRRATVKGGEYPLKRPG